LAGARTLGKSINLVAREDGGFGLDQRKAMQLKNLARLREIDLLAIREHAGQVKG
jgi:hypothetical protein